MIATTGIILASLYILWLYQRTMTGPLKPGCEDIKDLTGREIVAVAPLVAVIIGLGCSRRPRWTSSIRRSTRRWLWSAWGPAGGGTAVVTSRTDVARKGGQ